MGSDPPTGLWTPRFWLGLAATGTAAGLAGAALTQLLHALQHLAYGYRAGPFLEGVERAGTVRLLVSLPLAGVVTGLGWWLLGRTGPFVGTTRAAREGLPLAVGPTLAGGVLQIVAVALGASLGREAAPKDAGAAAGSWFGRRLGLTGQQQRVLLACGAGAGMAAVYDVPLGGALFALEVLLGTLALPCLVPAFATAALATAVAHAALLAGPTYDLPGYRSSTSALVLALALGPLAGVVAVGFVRLTARARREAARGRRIAVAVPVTFAGLAGVGLALPQLLGNGRSATQLALSDRFGALLLLAVLLGKPLATAVCLRAGATGGLFTPVLTTGAALGGLAGLGWAHVWPGTPPGLAAVVGAGAVLAAATRGPVSSVVLVLELTAGGTPLLLPLVVAAAGASLVAHLLHPRSIYDGAGPAVAASPR